MPEINCNNVYGWDLRNGLGFNSENDAKSTIDFRSVEWGSYWKINGKIYELTINEELLANFIELMCEFKEYEQT